LRCGSDDAVGRKLGSRCEWLQRSGYLDVVSATDVIKELEELPSEEREKVLRWLQQQGLKDLWRRANEVMDDAPRLTEEEILKLPRVRPAGF
jgi:Mg/Co/Ni transporter MgtE